MRVGDWSGEQAKGDNQRGKIQSGEARDLRFGLFGNQVSNIIIFEEKERLREKKNG